MKNEVYDWVTERILTLLDKGQVPWHKPWDGETGAPMNFVSKKPYRGINTFLLAFSGYTSPYWMSFKQARTLGGRIKKGEKSHMITFYTTLTYKKDSDSDKETHYPYLVYYNVFNFEQIDGIEAPKAEEKVRTFEPIEEAARLIREMPKRPTINHGGARACYSSMYDKVTVPIPESFHSKEEYYCTMFHELGHSTGHKDRLNRFEAAVSDHIFGSQSYSKEELVAEMTAAFLNATVGIVDATIDNSAAYIASWRKKLSDDPKLIVQAAHAAQKAADFILNKKKEEVAE